MWCSHCYVIIDNHLVETSPLMGTDVIDIYAPPAEQLGTRRPTLSNSSDKDVGDDNDDEPLVFADEDSCSSGRPSWNDFPPSCFELRPQVSCLYAVLNECTPQEVEVFKMALSDEQVVQIGEIHLLPNSLERLLSIVPRVQEYLDEGVTTFKILSAVESDGSRNSYIICSSTTPSSGSLSSSSSGLSLANIDF